MQSKDESMTPQWNCIHQIMQQELDGGDNMGKCFIYEKSGGGASPDFPAPNCLKSRMHVRGSGTLKGNGD